MTTMTKKQARLILLRCDEGLCQSEIAMRIGRTESTIKNTWTLIYKKTGLSAYQVCTAFGRGEIDTSAAAPPDPHNVYTD